MKLRLTATDPDHVLTRTSGPSGWAEHNGTRTAVAGWELFEGDPESPHMCRGWFRCPDPTFPARTNTLLRLHLVTDTGTERTLEARIAHASSTEPLWEFIAAR